MSDYIQRLELARRITSAFPEMTDDDLLAVCDFIRKLHDVPADPNFLRDMDALPKSELDEQVVARMRVEPSPNNLACPKCGGTAWQEETSWRWMTETWVYNVLPDGNMDDGQQVKQDGSCEVSWICDGCGHTQDNPPGTSDMEGD